MEDGTLQRTWSRCHVEQPSFIGIQLCERALENVSFSYLLSCKVLHSVECSRGSALYKNTILLFLNRNIAVSRTETKSVDLFR